LFVPIEENPVGEGKIIEGQGKECPFGLLPFFEIEHAITVPLNGDPGVLQPDPPDPDFPVEQREKRMLFNDFDIYAPVSAISTLPDI